MPIKVQIYGQISYIYGKERSIEFKEGLTVLQLINILQKTVGASQRTLGEFKINSPDLGIIVNGKNIAFLDGLQTELNDSDVVIITPFVDGG